MRSAKARARSGKIEVQGTRRCLSSRGARKLLGENLVCPGDHDAGSIGPSGEPEYEVLGGEPDQDSLLMLSFTWLGRSYTPRSRC